MTRAELKQVFDGLTFERDARKRPDATRRDRFGRGWRLGASSGAYSVESLRRLTWQNLGYRLGLHFGPRLGQEVDRIYEMLVEEWSAWAPRLNEDFLLEAYWRRARGRIYVEVPIGGSEMTGAWSLPCTRRRLDGVRSSAPERLGGMIRFESVEFGREIQTTAVELIEAKPCLNRPVIGQIIAGRDMFERQYGVSAARCTIVCARTDAALEWVCAKHGIHVEVVAPLGARDNGR